MLLVIDIGNSEIVVGVFKNAHLRGQWRVATHLHKTPDEYGLLLAQLMGIQGISPAQITGVIFSSVVPPLTPIFREMTEGYFSVPPMIVSEKLKTGLTIGYENPKEVGADRIVNAAAVYHLYGGPAVIVDLGTATTFCAVTQAGDYLGGAIAPGLLVAAEALFSRTATLPRIQLMPPKKAIGTNTVDAMQSGLIPPLV